MNTLANISTQECLTQKLLQQYCKQQLSGDALYEVENHIGACDMCSDAVEGYMFMTAPNVQIADALKNPFETIKPQTTFLSFVNKKVWLMASSLVLLFGISYAIFTNQKKPETIAANLKKNSEKGAFIKSNGDNEIPKDNAATVQETAIDKKMVDEQKQTTAVKNTNINESKVSADAKNAVTDAVNTMADKNIATAENANSKLQKEAPVVKKLETKIVNTEAFTNKEKDGITAKETYKQKEQAAASPRSVQQSKPTIAETENVVTTTTSKQAQNLNNNYVADNYRGNESKTNLRRPKESKSLPAAQQLSNNNANTYDNNSNASQAQFKPEDLKTSKKSKKQGELDAKILSADKLLESKNYAGALNNYLQVSDVIKNENPTVYLKIAQCYYATNETEAGDKALATYGTITKTSARKIQKLKARFAK